MKYRNLVVSFAVGIKGDRIAAISEEPLQGKKEMQADGLVVAPGFIDI